VNLHLEIERIFTDQAFARPLFYSCPGGLRFELSETGGMIEQFLLALRKSTEICADIFNGESTLVTCLRFHSVGQRFAHRPLLQSLHSAGVEIPSERSIWSERTDPDDWFCEGEPEYWINLAFETPARLLQALLWCALAADFEAIAPNPRCAVYLFNLKAGVMVFPYDDRGMDVVGPNKALLSRLYHRHQTYLLDYDRPAMDADFAGSL